MGSNEAVWRVGSRMIVLCSIAVFAAVTNAAASAPGETSKLDCGVNALYVLLRLEGRPVTLDRLESALPDRRPEGCSMAELATAASFLGMNLDGVSVREGSPPLDRPAIVFLRDARGGHFAVLRPVGTTGTMVQVIDPPHVPWIADYDRIFSAKSWTGRILVRRDAWIGRNLIPLLMALAGCILLVMGLSHGLRTVRAKGTEKVRPRGGRCAAVILEDVALGQVAAGFTDTHNSGAAVNN